MLRLKLKHLKHYYIFCIDIYSASWGPDDDGRTVDGPGPLTRQALGNHHIYRPNRPQRLVVNALFSDIVEFTVSIIITFDLNLNHFFTTVRLLAVSNRDIYFFKSVLL